MFAKIVSIDLIMNERHTLAAVQLSWFDAKAWCSKRGLNLVSLQTIPKAEHFLDLVGVFCFVSSDFDLVTVAPNRGFCLEEAPI